MIIFSKKSLTFSLSFFLVTFLCFSTSAAILTFTATSPGSWNLATNWSGGQIPTSADSVIIPDAKIVSIFSSTICGSLNVQGELKIQTAISLNVLGVVTVEQGILNVGDGSLSVGTNMHIIGNGNANQGRLSVNNGIVTVVGSIFFWKDQIGGAINGSDAYRLLDITGISGSIGVGGTLVGPNGTNATTLAQTTQNAFIFKGVSPYNFWDEPSNWMRGSIPGSGDNVIIPYNYVAKLRTDQAVNNINLLAGSNIEYGTHTLAVSGDLNNSGGTLTSSTGWLKFISTTVNQVYSGTSPITLPNIGISKTGKILLLNGHIQVSSQVEVSSGTLNANGNLTLLSTATNSANVGELVNGADLVGDVNVQIFMRGGNRGYRLVSSPINDFELGEGSFKQLQKAIIITGPGGTSRGFDRGGDAQPEALTLSLYNETTGARQSSTTPIQNIADHIPAGRGFYAFFRGKQMGGYSLNLPKLNAPFVTPEDVTVTYTGPINKFNQSPISLTNSQQADDLWNGYNLLGNPYPSTIDYEKIPRGSNIKDQLIALKPNGSSTSYKSNPEIANNNGSRYIQPGQAFFLVSSGPASVTFEESFKTSSVHLAGYLAVPHTKLTMTSGNFSEKDDNSRVKVLRLSLQDEKNTDETTIAFLENSSAKADQDDVLYFSGSSVSLSSMSADFQKLAINLMPTVKNIKEIKLSVNSTASSQLKLNFTDLSAVKGYQVLLKDVLFPNTFFNMKQSSIYTFSIDKSNPSTYGSNRFSIILKPEPVAPPFLFTAQMVKADVELNWSSNIANEVNYFEIEVSTDKLSFKNISQVKNAAGSTGNVMYSFVDKSPFYGVSFYRIKQHNTDGSSTYTEMKMVDPSVSRVAKVSIYPNPTSDKIEVKLTGETESDIEATITNVKGQKLKNATFSSMEMISFEVGHLPKGIYHLELRSFDNKKVIGRSKFVVWH